MKLGQDKQLITDPKNKKNFNGIIQRITAQRNRYRVLQEEFLASRRKQIEKYLVGTTKEILKQRFSFNETN
jgi:hypothetical protein